MLLHDSQWIGIFDGYADPRQRLAITQNFCLSDQLSLMLDMKACQAHAVLCAQYLEHLEKAQSAGRPIVHRVVWHYRQNAHFNVRAYGKYWVIELTPYFNNAQGHCMLGLLKPNAAAPVSQAKRHVVSENRLKMFL
jgi:hypothetical protein